MIKLLLALSLITVLAGCGDNTPSSGTGIGGGGFPPCYDINHTRVLVRTTKSTEGGPAFSTLTNTGSPIILFNEQFMEQIAHSNAMVMFVYEHECGHHALGHIQGAKTQSGMDQQSHFKQELEADCYSAKQLKTMGYNSSSITDIIDDVYPWPKDPEHPSGKVRSRHVAACFKAAGE